MTRHRHLSSERQKLFDDHAYVARSETRRFLARSRGRRDYDPLEVQQAALNGLWKASFYWNPDLARFTFGAYCTVECRRAIIYYYFGHEGNAPCSSAARAAAAFTVSGSEPKPIEDQPEMTLMDCAEDSAANRELACAPGEDRLASRLFEIREAIRAPGLLSARERRVLRLRFEAGLRREAIAAKLGLSEPRITAALGSAIRKLRGRFAAEGALPPGAAILNSGHGRNAA